MLRKDIYTFPSKMFEFGAVALIMGAGFAAICYYRHRQREHIRNTEPVEMDDLV